MIDNPNKNNFYSPEEMVDRQNYIPILKENLLRHLEELTKKIQNEEPFTHRNMNLDDLGDIDSQINEILNNWYY